MPHQTPTQFENPNTTDPTPDTITEEGEILLYGLQGMLSALSLEMKVTPRGEPRDTQEALQYLFTKDRDRARMVHDCLYMARVLIEEATTLIDAGIHWKTIEELYCPAEADFIDCPGTWLKIGQDAGDHAEAQSACNSPPIPTEFAVPPPPAIAAPEVAPQPVRRASKGALRSLGRELRSECEHEKRRFYAIAQQHGFPTGPSAAPAMRAALSEMLGEPIASRKQLTARQWSLAASSIVTEDLCWEAPAAPRQSHAATRAERTCP